MILNARNIDEMFSRENIGNTFFFYVPAKNTEKSKHRTLKYILTIVYF